MAPQQVRKLAFSRRSAKTKTASDWSIYSRDFTRVHLDTRSPTDVNKFGKVQLDSP